MKDNWEREFKQLCREITVIPAWQEYYCQKDWKLSSNTFSGVKNEIKKFIQFSLATQKELFIKIIESKRMDECGGWDLAFEDYKSCCPGDDCAHGYNQALDDIKAELERRG